MDLCTPVLKVLGFFSPHFTKYNNLSLLKRSLSKLAESEDKKPTLQKACQDIIDWISEDGHRN